MNRTEQENQTEELLAYYRLAYEKEKEKNTRCGGQGRGPSIKPVNRM